MQLPDLLLQHLNHLTLEVIRLNPNRAVTHLRQQDIVVIDLIEFQNIFILLLHQQLVLLTLMPYLVRLLLEEHLLVVD